MQKSLSDGFVTTFTGKGLMLSPCSFVPGCDLSMLTQIKDDNFYFQSKQQNRVLSVYLAALCTC